MTYRGSEAEKAYRREYRKTYNKSARAEFMAWKATLSCTKCGENHPATLDFHHHTPHPDNIKINKLVKFRRYGFAKKEIIEKCIVLCSNCHRKHHWDDNRKVVPPV